MLENTRNQSRRFRYSDPSLRDPRQAKEFEIVKQVNLRQKHSVGAEKCSQQRNRGYTATQKRTRL